MPIIRNVQAPNGAPVTYHMLSSIEASAPFDVVRVTIQSWTDSSSYLSGANPVWTWYQPMPYASMGLDLIAAAETYTIGNCAEFIGGTIVAATAGNDIEALRVRKRAEINAARWLANNTTFTYAGKQIAVDPLSRSDVNGTATEILNQGALPEGWPGAWKAVDNTYVAIPDLATWKDFHHALYLQGLANFVHSQTLKAYLDDPLRTIEEIEAVHWGMSLP